MGFKEKRGCHPALQIDKGTEPVVQNTDSRESRREKIKAKLAIAGFSLTRLDELHQMSRGSAQRALNGPHMKGEKAIADALGEPAAKLWPERYDGLTGQRLSPQPRTNYTPLASLAERRNEQVVVA